MKQFEYEVGSLIEETALFTSKDRLLVACSGGVDSMALLHFLLEYRKKRPIQIVVAHVDHMLRGEVSAADRRFVESFCREHGLLCVSTAIPIQQIIEAEGGNVQAVCRKERYRFFEEQMTLNACNYLVTAHHADDQLETLLINMAKSPSATGMQGIKLKRPFANGFIIRPFLQVTKDEIISYLKEKGGTYREDSSNAKDNYTRNRIRHHILPLLKAENPKVAQHSVQISRQLEEDDHFLMTLAHTCFERIVKELDEKHYELEIKDLLGEPVALQKRVVLILLNYIYKDTITAQNSILCLSILKLIQTQNGSAMLNLPQQMIAKREYGKLIIEKQQSYQQSAYERIMLDEWTEYEGYRVYIGDSSKHVTAQSEQGDVYYIHPSLLIFPIHIRQRQDGDRIHLAGMASAKRLSRLFIDEKVPLAKRDSWPILVDGKNEVLAVLGIRVSNIFSNTRRQDDDFIVIVQRVE